MNTNGPMPAAPADINLTRRTAIESFFVVPRGQHHDR
jgi:hypothetical protein